MAGFFQTVIRAKEPMFSHCLKVLEAKTGNNGLDVKYIGDIMHRAHHVMRQLGLDTSDTTNLELYRTLIAHAEDDALFGHTHDVVFVRDGEVISFNHDDIKENVSLTYEMRSSARARCEVQHGLFEQYEKSGVSKKAVNHELALAGIAECSLDDYHEVKKRRNAKDKPVAPYILCVGDIFSDVFIKLLEDEARIDTDKDGSKRLSLPFGSKPPYDSVETVTSVGPSPNAAVSCARLGLRVGLMSWLGQDKTAKDSLDYLAHENIDTTPLVRQKNTISNTYYVLRYGADRTILVKNEAYEYSWKQPATKPDWVYLSLISKDSWRLHLDLLDYLEKNPEIKLAFQPGTFHFKWGAAKLKKLYARASIVVMNREEAVDVTGKSYDSLHELAQGLHGLGPEYVVITDGPSGSYASYDGTLYRMPNYPDPAPPVDRTGAGDAFASTIVAALALGESVQTALTWAPINSMNVVQKLGAQAGLLKKSEIEKHIKNAPEDYKLEEMN
jgi:ribokinase